MTTDRAGNPCVIILFTESTAFSAATLSRRGARDLFVAKRSSAGIWEWVVAAGGSGSDRAAGVATDAAGHIFITDNFNEQARFGSTVLTGQRNTDVFVARWSEQGQGLWAAASGDHGQDRDRATALEISSRDDLLIAGQFAKTAGLGARQLVSSGRGPRRQVCVAQATLPQPSGRALTAAAQFTGYPTMLTDGPFRY